MKIMGMMIGLTLLASALLSGCVVIPAGGWYGHGRGWHQPHAYSPSPPRHGR
jgi:hypothetical protein